MHLAGSRAERPVRAVHDLRKVGCDVGMILIPVEIISPATAGPLMKCPAQMLTGSISGPDRCAS